MKKMNRETIIKCAVQEKEKEFLKLGIEITDIDEIVHDPILVQEFLECKINTKRDVEKFAAFCLEQVNQYADKLGKERISLDMAGIEMTEHPTGKMTFEELLEKEKPRKVAEKEILSYCTNYHIDLLKVYLEAMYEKAFNEANSKRKNVVCFKFNDISYEGISVKNKDDGKLFFLRDGVNFLLKKDSKLRWELV